MNNALLKITKGISRLVLVLIVLFIAVYIYVFSSDEVLSSESFVGFAFALNVPVLFVLVVIFSAVLVLLSFIKRNEIQKIATSRFELFYFLIALLLLIITVIIMLVLNQYLSLTQILVY